jgi:hypothetical protein
VNKKTLEEAKHIDRGDQFKYINNSMIIAQEHHSRQ